MLSRSATIILLDIGNVIVDVDFTTFCANVAAETGNVDAIFRKYCAGALKEKLDKGMIAPKTFLEQMAADPLLRKKSVHELKDAWQSVFSLKESVTEGIARLQRGNHLWIMSDTDPLHFTALLNRFPILRTMDRFFLSFEHGFLKHSSLAFLHVLQSTGVSPDDLILIDDKAENCRAAESAGIGSIHFTDWHDLQKKADKLLKCDNKPVSRA